MNEIKCEIIHKWLDQYTIKYNIPKPNGYKKYTDETLFIRIKLFLNYLQSINDVDQLHDILKKLSYQLELFIVGNQRLPNDNIIVYKIKRYR